MVNFGNKLRLSCAKLKFSLVRVVTEDDIEVIVAVQYLSGWGGWVVDKTKLMQDIFKLKLELKLKMSLAIV